jgi:hypothetical protein
MRLVIFIKPLVFILFEKALRCKRLEAFKGAATREKQKKNELGTSCSSRAFSIIMIEIDPFEVMRSSRVELLEWVNELSMGP